MSIFGTRISGFFSGGTSGGGGGGTVVGVTGTLPISSSGGTTPDISISQASGTTNGFLTSSNWTTFNNKVGGSGTINFIPKWSATGTITDGLMFDNGTSVGLGTTTPSASFKFDVVGSIRASAFGFFGSDQVRINTSTSGFVELYDGSEKKMLVGNGATNFANFTAFNGNTFSFNNEGNYIPSRLVGFNSQLFKSAGTDTHNVIEVNPEIQVSGGTTTLRGFYYNPNLTIQTGLTNIAFQNVSGNIIFGNFGGSALNGRVLQMNTNGQLSAQDGSFTLYSGTSNDIVTATSNSIYQYGNIFNGNDLVFDISNNEIYFRDNGSKNGLNIAINTNIVQLGVLNGAGGDIETYLQFEGAGNKFFAWDSNNGVQNGLEVDFANLLFFFGNYRLSEGGVFIDATNHTFGLSQSNYNTSGYMEFQAYELKLTGTNLETATPPTGVTPTYIKVTINSVPYLIEALTP
jgi:hypothetical protein